MIFGTLLDRTNTRMGKARPWMLWAYVGCAVLLVAIFAIPPSLGDFAKYTWFFIAYTLLNAVFFTANNIAYSSLTALITRNKDERVQMGSIRFMFAFTTNMLIQTFTVGGVMLFGGGAGGWRNMAIVYALIGLAINTLSVYSVKELSPEELEGENNGPEEDKLPLLESAKILFSNKYYLIILVIFLLTQIFTAMLNMGIFFMKYVLGDERLLGTFAWAINVLHCEQMWGHVSHQHPGLHHCRRRATRSAGGRLHAECAADASVLRHRLPGYESVAGHTQRPDRRGIGIHVVAHRQTHRRTAILLHLARGENR